MCPPGMAMVAASCYLDADPIGPRVKHRDVDMERPVKSRVNFVRDLTARFSWVFDSVTDGPASFVALRLGCSLRSPERNPRFKA
jgi:hypothetical protein